MNARRAAHGLVLGGMAGAGSLLRELDFPRDDISGMERAHSLLASALQQAGIEPARVPFVAHPARATVAGIVFLCTGICWLMASCGAPALPRRGVRLLLPAGILAAGMALLVLGGAADPLLPAMTMTNLTAVVEPRETARGEVLLVAHTDSKTEWLDHVQRGVLGAGTGLAAAAAFGCAAGAWGNRRRRGRFAMRWQRAGRWATGIAGLGISLCGANLLAGKGPGARSHGIVDDGAACALLVEVARAAHEAPLRTTRLRFLWTAAEECGAEGSAAVALRTRSGLPLVVLNLECVGGGPALACAAAEWTGRTIAPPDPALGRTLAEVTPGTLHRLPFPVVTDAGPWLRAGVPAITLLGVGRDGQPRRGLHRATDCLAALDASGLDLARRTTLAFLARWDSLPPGP
jgi:hypothetical protein